MGYKMWCGSQLVDSYIEDRDWRCVGSRNHGAVRA
jgi:hypothetical protein